MASSDTGLGGSDGTGDDGAAVISLAARRQALAVPVLPDTSHETIQVYVMDQIDATSGGVLYSEGQWWRVGDFGAWVPMPESRIWAEVQALNGLATLEGASAKKDGKCIRVTAGMCESVAALARARFDQSSAFAHSVKGFISPAGLWTCSQADGWKVRKPTPADRVRLWVPVDPDFENEPKLWSAAIYRMWSHEDDYQERFSFLHEWTGGMLCGESTKYQQAPILLGDGENGKSVVINVIAGVIPLILRCSVTPDDLENNRFASSNLVGKALNSVPELPGGELLTSHRIKAIIDGSEQGAERKNKDGFSFRPFAGHIFAANSLPRVRDLSHGFWRRWVPLTCTAPRLTAEERKTNLAEEILASEVPQILGFVMRCYESMVRQGRGYTVVPSVATAITTWRSESDSVQAWIEEACERGGPSTFRSLYSHYKRHAEESGSRPVGSKSFASRLDALGFPGTRTTEARFRPIVVRLGC